LKDLLKELGKTWTGKNRKGYLKKNLYYFVLYDLCVLYTL